jgi:hypothetical protein
MLFLRRSTRQVGTVALVLAGLACAGSAAARPGRLAPQEIKLLAPTTITISNFPIHRVLVFQLVRQLYAEEGVTLPTIPEGDTLLVSTPVERGAYEVVYRVRLHPGEKVHLVSLDALYRTPGDSVTYVLTDAARGELGRVWNAQLRMSRKLFERRFGKCCVYGTATSRDVNTWSPIVLAPVDSAPDRQQVLVRRSAT